MLSIHLRLGLPSGLFPSGFPTNNLYTFIYKTIKLVSVSRTEGKLLRYMRLYFYLFYRLQWTLKIVRANRTMHNINCRALWQLQTDSLRSEIELVCWNKSHYVTTGISYPHWMVCASINMTIFYTVFNQTSSAADYLQIRSRSSTSASRRCVVSSHGNSWTVYDKRKKLLQTLAWTWQWYTTT
jgi:hypothetical protein